MQNPYYGERAVVATQNAWKRSAGLLEAALKDRRDKELQTVPVEETNKPSEFHVPPVPIQSPHLERALPIITAKRKVAVMVPNLDDSAASESSNDDDRVDNSTSRITGEAAHGIRQISKRPRLDLGQNHDGGQSSPRLGNSSPVGEERWDPPHWYTTFSRQLLKKPMKEASREKEVRLNKFRHDCVERTKKYQQSSKHRLTQAYFDEVRKNLHTLEFIPVSKHIVRKCRMLHNEEGLPAIFIRAYDGGVDWPWDIRADAKVLCNKWAREIFDPSPLRGIKVISHASKPGSKRVKSSRIDEKYALKVRANYFGNGDLVNGQWWPNQLCTVRDGAHGAAQGGIYGTRGEGAHSIVMSGSQYNDKDEGININYCGTDGSNFEISRDTQLMIESWISKKPIRVLRTAELRQDNPNRPSHGIRYDGLYKVVNYWKVENEPEKQKHVFHLIRLPGQDPIRISSIGLGARPTEEEVSQYKEIREILGF